MEKTMPPLVYDTVRSSEMNYTCVVVLDTMTRQYAILGLPGTARHSNLFLWIEAGVLRCHITDPRGYSTPSLTTIYKEQKAVEDAMSKGVRPWSGPLSLAPANSFVSQ